jgi:DNA modification methylase
MPALRCERGGLRRAIVVSADAVLAGDERWVVLEGDCVEVLAQMPPASVDSVVCDPPYGLEFMGREWDRIAGDRGRWAGQDRTALMGEASHMGGKPVLPNFGGQSRNGRCENCNGWRWSGEDTKCTCENPSFRYKGMGAEQQAWHEAWAREAWRVLKPGGHLLAFGGTRTYHRLASAVEDVGFEIRDSVMWLYGTGFPKSLNVSKAIDNAAGAKREVVGTRQRPGGPAGMTAEHGWNDGPMAEDDATVEVTRAETPEAKQWEGWGTALKPAHEPIVVARKPLGPRNVAANVLQHGTGGLNIAATSLAVAADDPVRDAVWTSRSSGFREGTTGFLAGSTEDGERASAAPPPEGRFPPNVMLSHLEDCALVGTRRVRSDSHGGDGERPAGFANVGSEPGTVEPSGPEHRDADGREEVEDWECAAGCPVAELEEQTAGDDSTLGGATRFFYCAKASRAERNAGLDDFPERERPADSAWIGQCSACGKQQSKGERGVSSECCSAPTEWVTPTATQNIHPTVKPIDVMRWLVRLVTPPGGVVLDPFTGSGTTGCAAMVEGFRFVGVEQNAEDYLAIARARIGWWADHPQGVEVDAAVRGSVRRRKTRESGQLGLLE